MDGSIYTVSGLFNFICWLQHRPLKFHSIRVIIHCYLLPGLFKLIYPYFYHIPLSWVRLNSPIRKIHQRNYMIVFVSEIFHITSMMMTEGGEILFSSQRCFMVLLVCMNSVSHWWIDLIKILVMLFWLSLSFPLQAIVKIKSPSTLHILISCRMPWFINAHETLYTSCMMISPSLGTLYHRSSNSIEESRKGPLMKTLCAKYSNCALVAYAKMCSDLIINQNETIFFIEFELSAKHY